MDVMPAAVTQPGSKDRGGTLFQWGLAIALALCIAFVSTPTAWVVLRELVLYPMAELVALASVVVGVYRYRPQERQAWLFIGAGLFLFLIADVIWGSYKALSLDPFPSAADVFYLGAYPLFAVGLVIATIRRRSFGVDVRATIDAAIFTVSCAHIAWVYIVTPVLNDDALTPLERLVTLLYPAVDLLLLAAAARFVIGSSWNIRALRILAIGFLLLFVGDVIFALNSAGTRYEEIWDTALLVGIVLIGVAALDPSMRALTEEGGDPATRSDRARRVLIAGAVLVPPLILISQQLRGQPLFLGANVVALVILIVLAAARSQVLAVATERAIRREATLNRYTSDLLAATDREQLFEAARHALNTFAKRAKGEASLILAAEPGTGRDVPFSALVTLRGEHVGTIVANADPATLRRWRESLTTIATQLSIALERDWLLAAERERTETLSEQNTRLRELDAMKDRFVSAVTHELRTPLTSMVGYLEFLSEGEAGALNSEQAHMVDIVDRNCRRLSELISDILVTAQLDSGSVEYKFTQIDLVRLATKQIESIQAVADKQGVRVQLIVETPPPLIPADEMRIGQVIDNLLSNAIKFTPEGGSVMVTVGLREDTASLEVSDTGVGIPANEIDKIFGRFYRTSTASSTAGTGLGLWIARSIAKAHGGTIGVTSELNVGTTFHVQLPLHAADRPTTTQHYEVRT